MMHKVNQYFFSIFKTKCLTLSGYADYEVVATLRHMYDVNLFSRCTAITCRKKIKYTVGLVRILSKNWQFYH